MPLPKDMGKCMSKVKKEYPSGRKKKGTKMSKKKVHQQHVAMCMNEDAGAAKTIVIYGGRFHPFHSGHKSVYDALVKQFGADSVYIVSSGKQAPVSSPFAFDEKKKMMTMLGVPANRIVQVKNPYQPKEITDHVDGDNTSIVFAVSEKDAERFTFKPKKDGSPSYMQPMSKQRAPLTQTGYVMIAPTLDFKVGGKSVKSASEIRNMYIQGDDKARLALLADLYGGANAKRLKGLFDKRLSMVETAIRVLTKSGVLTEAVQQFEMRAKIRILESRIRREEFKYKR